LSSAHDEMLFIAIHQASEIWMKLSIHELGAASAALAEDQLRPAFKMLSRVARIQAQMIQSWDVLSTMTPPEFLKFRDHLGPSSGFQSYQYRQIEFMLGAKDRAFLEQHTRRPAVLAALTQALEAPSFYDRALELLVRRGFAIAPAHLARDLTQPYTADDSVRAAWLEIYRAPDTHWELYELGEKLVDLEDWFQVWRFRHMKTVRRLIGQRRGTGGSTGAAYLQSVVDRPLFPELWDLRTDLMMPA
jgi:tryptophan 2,3-dioxygenase